MSGALLYANLHGLSRAKQVPLTPVPWPATTSHINRKERCMADKPKMCMLCGIREVETSSICPVCAENVKREAMGQQAAVKRQAEQEIRRQGVSPEASPSTPKL